MTNFSNPATLFENTNNIAADSHPSNILNISSCHGLSISDDSQSFQLSARITRSLFGIEFTDPRSIFFPGLKSPTITYTNQLQTFIQIVLLQLGYNRFNLIFVRLGFFNKQSLNIADTYGGIRSKKCRFNNILQFRIIITR